MVSHIKPNQNIETSVDQENLGNNQKSKNTKSETIPGISKWFEWNWPVTSQFAGYIHARSLPHIGKWIDFSPAQIANLCDSDKRINENNENNKIENKTTTENNKSARNLRAADRYSPEDMHTCLKELAEE
ncbi:hypothetical protein GLOIN_2v1791933 [Rhizophagus clarus]|uniref:Uncharacterized protein n=1 Tax=Rhizophagus clarus TaxID=94130 RepID=A0A8H3QKZ4_9GLOM|nr:hypothetical protein GLOIN_2v1791933 [Rhizophagus clarus]